MAWEKQKIRKEVKKEIEPLKVELDFMKVCLKRIQNKLIENEIKNSRKGILERDKFKCTLCNDTEDLQVHHVKPNHLRENDYDGLKLTLCKYCHWYLHHSPKSSINSSLLVKRAVVRKNGVTESYNGNKWGRKSLSNEEVDKIKDYKKNNPKSTIRGMASTLGLSRSVVHKYLQIIKEDRK